jgi:hypothetical protein
MRIDRITVLVIIALIVIAVLVIQSGGLGNFLSYDCRQIGERLHLSWYWSVQSGCMVQQPNGVWTVVDTNPLNDNPSQRH